MNFFYHSIFKKILVIKKRGTIGVEPNLTNVEIYALPKSDVPYIIMKSNFNINLQ